jgi:hypothetical protein
VRGTEALTVPATITTRRTACADPTFTASGAEGTQSRGNGYQWTNNDAWNGNQGRRRFTPAHLPCGTPFRISPMMAEESRRTSTANTTLAAEVRPAVDLDFSSVTSSFAKQAPIVSHWDASDIWTNN